MNVAERTRLIAESLEMMNRKMVQQDLPFERPLEPGWQGKRYLLCSDGVWHLVLGIRDGNVADTQCCEDVDVQLPLPEGSTEPMCETCVKLHFDSKK